MNCESKPEVLIDPLSAERVAFLTTLEERLVPGVRETSRTFLLEALSLGLDHHLPLPARSLTYKYYGTDTRLSALGSNDLVTPGQAAYQIQQGILAMWDQMPPEIRGKHDPKEIVLRKTAHGRTQSEETRQKMKKSRIAAWQRPDYRSKHKVAIQNRPPVSEATKQKLTAARQKDWEKPGYRKKQEKERQNREPAFRQKMSKIRREASERKRKGLEAGRLWWNFSQSRGLLDRATKASLISKAEVVILKDFYSGRSPQEPTEELLYKFFQAMATVR